MTARSQPPNLQLLPIRARRWAARHHRIKTILAVLSLACISVTTIGGSAFADGQRVALVMIAEKYAHYGKSPIPTTIGVRIADALKQHGFDVSVATDPNNAVARATLRDFAQKADGAQAALVVLAGHGASSAGRTYFLPTNAEITRDTDLLSRALAVPSVAQIASRARHGGVFFLMTVPDIASTLQSIAARPSMASVENNVVVVFSTSEKVPVSRVDKISEQAARDFADAASETPLLLATLVNAASAGGVGKVVGTASEIDLAKPPPVPQAASPAAAAAAHEAEARRAAEARAREAEQRAREAEARARQAEERARQEALKAEDAKSAPRSEPVTPAPTPQTASLEPAAPAPEDIQSLQIVEALLGRSQRKQVQAKLRQLGYYKGGIDAIFGELTREAISEYQRSISANATGYLTPQQFQALTTSN